VKSLAAIALVLGNYAAQADTPAPPAEAPAAADTEAKPADGEAAPADGEATPAEATPAEAPPADGEAPADEAVDAREAPAVETAASPEIMPSPTGPRLLVMDLVDSGAGADVVDGINQAIGGQALKSFAGEVVTAQQIRVAVEANTEQQLMGCESEKCMTDIASLIEADRVVGGSVAKVGDDYLITVLVVNAKDGARLAQEQRKVPGVKDMYFYAARQLVSKALTGAVDDPSVPVQVQASVEGAQVAVDGNAVGLAPAIVRIAPGQHEITVTADGYAVWRTVATVEEASPVQLTADLVKEALPLWPATVVAAGVAAAGFIGFGVAGIAAQDAFDGSFGMFTQPADSYLGVVPVDSIDLADKQKDVETLGVTANSLLIVGIIGTAAAAAITVTDIVINGE
jgi:hypothetical protein